MDILDITNPEKFMPEIRDLTLKLSYMVEYYNSLIFGAISSRRSQRRGPVRSATSLSTIMVLSEAIADNPDNRGSVLKYAKISVFSLSIPLPEFIMRMAGFLFTNSCQWRSCLCRSRNADLVSK